MIKTEPEPVLDRDALLATLLDRMEPIQIFQHRPFTCIQIRTWFNCCEYMAFGFSHMPKDWNEDRASDLAIKKAVLMAYVEVRRHERVVARQEAYALLMKEAGNIKQF